MREFKFRIWAREAEQMCSWESLLEDEEKTADHIDLWKGPTVAMCMAGYTDDCDVMQYTGLKDKNGVEIYEGDIFLNGESPRVIDFSGGNFKAVTADRTRSILLSFIVGNPRNIVIGNIHENPELLQGAGDE